MNFLRCPDGIPTTRANVLSCAARPRRCGCAPCSAVRSCPGDMEPGKLIAAYENVGQAVLQYEVQQLVRGACVAPPVFVAVLHQQPVSFGGNFEASIVVGIARTAILYAVLVVVVMYHFVKQGRGYVLDRPGQRPGSYIDFVGAAQLGNPCIFPQGEMAVGAGRGLNGNGRS